jgi:hypothetical protein
MLVMHFIFLALIPSPSQKVIRKFLVFARVISSYGGCVCVRVCGVRP